MTKLKNLAASLQLAYCNFRSTRLPKRVVVFESDDWGGVRMPNPTTANALKDAGLNVDDVSFNRLDGLECKRDLEALFDILERFCDSQGRPATFTCNMILGNPDFDKIEENGFTSFVAESLFDSYQRYYNEDLEMTWQQAINKSLVRPQFHCREHLNTQLWMHDLKMGQPETRLSFKHRFFGLRTKTSSPIQKHYLAAYSAETNVELQTIKEIAMDGLNRFESLFGFRSETFVACNYVWPTELEETLHSGGVKGIQTRIKHTAPQIEKGGQRIQIRRFTGQTNKFGQTYGVRNGLFEPYHNPSEDAVARALSEIEKAFFYRAPAILSTHRINYTSAMGETLRDQTLKSLVQLLTCIRKRWPDVEFLSSDELHCILRN